MRDVGISLQLGNGLLRDLALTMFMGNKLVENKTTSEQVLTKNILNKFKFKEKH